MIAALVALSVFVFVALFIFGLFGTSLEKRQAVQGRLDSYVQAPSFEESGGGAAAILKDKRLSGIPSIDSWLRSSTYVQKVGLDLARSGLKLRVGEYLMMRILAGAVMFLLGLVIAPNLWMALVMAVVGFFLPQLYVGRCQSQRLKQFDAELVDALPLVANSLKSGFGFLQAMENAARELPPPLSEEFHRVLQEVSIGSTAEDALTDLAQRVKSYDLDLVVTSMIIQRKVGGNLSEILDNISHTIRERVRILGEIRTLTTEARLSRWILTALPLVLFAVIYFIKPDYVGTLFTSSVGRILLMVGVVGVLVGSYLLQKLSTIEV